mgnify:CR=1 FL=1|tara:strand:+ start:171 stop:869 length:699 start_codon:yes stop_codon:yes gene_type:complete
MGCGCNMSGSGYSNAAGGGKGLIPEYTTTKVISDGTPGVVGSRKVKSCERPTDMVITSSRKTSFCNDWVGYPSARTVQSDTDPTDDMFNVAPGTVIQEGTPGVVGSRIVKGDDSDIPPSNMNVTSSRKSAYSRVWIGSPFSYSDGTPATTPKYRTAQSGDMRGLPGMTSKVDGGRPRPLDGPGSNIRFSGFDGAVATNNILRGRGRMVGFDGSVATNDILRGRGGMFRGFEG